MNLGLMDLNSWSRQGSEEEDMKQKDLRLNETNKKKKLKLNKNVCVLNSTDTDNSIHFYIKLSALELFASLHYNGLL